MALEFSPETRKKFAAMVNRYPKKEAAMLLPRLMRHGRDSEPGTTQPGISGDGGALHIDRLDRGGGINDRVSA